MVQAGSASEGGELTAMAKVRLVGKGRRRQWKRREGGALRRREECDIQCADVV